MAGDEPERREGERSARGHGPPAPAPTHHGCQPQATRGRHFAQARIFFWNGHSHPHFPAAQARALMTRPIPRPGPSGIEGGAPVTNLCPNTRQLQTTGDNTLLCKCRNDNTWTGRCSPVFSALKNLKSLGGNPVRVRIPARALHLARPHPPIHYECTTSTSPSGLLAARSRIQLISVVRG